MIRRDGAVRLAVFAIVVGVVLVFLPGPFAAVIDDVVAPVVGVRTAGVILSVLVLTGALVVGVRAIRRQPRTVSPLRESVDSQPRASVVGVTFEDSLERATDPDRPRARRAVDQAALAEYLADLAVESYALANDCDRTSATAAIEAGTWSTDRRATALLGGPDAPTPPLTVWLLDLLRSEHAYRRRVRHAIAAIDRLTHEDGSAETSWDGQESVPNATGDGREADETHDVDTARDGGAFDGTRDGSSGVGGGRT